MAEHIWYYGKVPAIEDYVRSESFQGVANIKRDWLDNSFERVRMALGDSFKDTFPNLPPVCTFSIFDGDSGVPILSITVPSRDSSGRPAWFAVFLDIPREYLHAGLEYVPDFYRGFLNMCNRLFQSDGRAFGREMRRDTLWSLQECLPRDIGSSKARVATFLDQTLLKDFVNSEDLANTVAIPMLRNLAFALLPMRDNIPKSFRATFRFPLSGKVDCRYLEIASWIVLTNAFIGKHDLPRTLFWTPNKLDVTFAGAENISLSVPYIMNSSNALLWDFANMVFPEDSISEELMSSMEGILEDRERTFKDVLYDLTALSTELNDD